MLFFSIGFYSITSSNFIVSANTPTSTDGSAGSLWIQVN